MRQVIAVALALLIGGLLAGCGSSGDDADGGGAADADTKATLTIWSYVDQKTFPYVTDWIDQFHQDYPNVTVDWTYVPQDQLVTKLLGAGLTSDGPDAVYLNPASASQLYSGGVLADLSERWASYGDADQFPDSVVTQVDGKVATVQGVVNISGIWYNKDVLDEVGVTPPKTVAEFNTALAQVATAGDTPFTTACEASEKGEFSALPWLLGEDLNYGTFTVPETAEVFQMFQDWAQAGYLPKDCVTWTGAIAWEKFMSGDVAFTYNGNWNAAAAADAPFNVGVMPLPAGSAGSHSIGGGEGVGIVKSSDQQDLAWEFWTSTALSRDGQLAGLEASGLLPARADLANADEIAASPFLPTFLSIVAEGGQRPSDPDTYDGMLALGKAFSAVVGGGTSPEQAAEELADATSGLG